MATGPQTFLSLNNSRRQRGLFPNHHHHHNSHAFHHHHNQTAQYPFQNQFLNPLARAYHHLTATLPGATQPHFHHNNAFHNAKTNDLNEDDSLSSVSMLSSEQTKRKVRWILSLGLLLPALAAIIGVVAWAVSAEVVMGVQREAALKNQQEFHNNYGYDDSLLDQLETRKLSLNSDRFKLAKQRNGLTRFGERINPNIKTLASTESKDNLIAPNENPINSNNRLGSNEMSSNNDNQIGNELNQEAKLATTIKPVSLKETEAIERTEDELDQKSKNSVEPGKNDSEKSNDIKSPSNNRTDSEDNNEFNEDDNSEDKSQDEKLNEEKDEEKSNNDKTENKTETKTEDRIEEKTEDKTIEEDKKASNDQADSINEKLEENDETTTPAITTKITTTKIQTTLSSRNDGDIKTTTTRQMNFNQDDKQSSKKSAGAQVAEVIDKLVAQRRGLVPSIVVVAPFRLKNGNKKLTVTEGNVHGVPAFGSRSISAQSLANMLSNSNKGSARQLNDKMTNKITTSTTTVSTTPSTTTSTTTEEPKSASNDDSGDEAVKSEDSENTNNNENANNENQSDNENKDEAKDDTNDEAKDDAKDVEKDQEKSKDDNSESEKEKNEDQPSNEDEDEEESATTTTKPVLINRIKEAVRTQTKKENNQLIAGKKSEKANEKLNTNASTKDKDLKQDRVRPTRTRSRKTSSRKKNTGNSLTINHNDGSKNDSVFNLDDNIRRVDDELADKLISLDLTKGEDLFLKDGFLKRPQTLEKAFKELEKSKNLKYQEHEYTHQTKEQESYYSSSSNNRKHTIKPIINLQPITQPSPSPHPQMNQHFLIKNKNSNKNLDQNNNSHHHNFNKNQNKNPNNNQNNKNFNKQFMNNHNGPTSHPFTLKDHRPLESMNNPRKIFNKAPVPASYQMNQMNQKRPSHDFHVHRHHQAGNFENQQNQQQKQILNHLLKANAATTNQIQRSMNVNSNNLNNNMNQLSHLKLPPPPIQGQHQRHIPKNQLIQHIQMLSNLNSKPKFFDLSQPTMTPEQYVELTQMSQMMDPKLSPVTLANAVQQNQYQTELMESSNHLMNVQPTKPQILYADNNQFNSELPNVNPTNQPTASASNNLQTAESIGHSQHSPASNVLSVGDSSNSAVINFDMKDPPGGDKGLHMSFGSGPSSGGAQLITNPLGIFKSLFLPLLPKPRMNLNGKVVFGVVLDTNIRKPPPKTYSPPVIVVPASKPHHHFFG